ncbi:MAG: PEP-CTERM sorting domain-containing protein [Acidobacteriaceae bacterium]
MKKLVGLCCLLVLGSLPSFAGTTLYANNATFGTPYVYQIDINNTLDTATVTNTYTNLSGQNGRGVVVVGNTMYYTTAYSGNVYSYNLTTDTNNGIAFTVAGASGLSTMAYDGTNFYIGDYSGTNNVYKYTPTGTLLATIPLSNCTGYCDGLEYFQKNGTGYLISNRADGYTTGAAPYDVYSTTGTLLTPNFINPNPDTGTTGIAFDGTDFFTSNINQGTLSEWNSSGTFQKSFTLTGYSGNYTPLIEDLSANYATVLPPPTPVIPEPNTLLLLGTGMMALACLGGRKVFAL